MADIDQNGAKIPLTQADYYFAVCGDDVMIRHGDFTLTMAEVYEIFRSAMAFDAKLSGNQRETIEKMLSGLRTIASGKGEYGEDIADAAEYREIARKTLKDIGCL